MQIFTKIKNKKYFIPTVLFLATFFIVFVTAFSPVTTPAAHAALSVSDLQQGLKGAWDATGGAVYSVVKGGVDYVKDLATDPLDKVLGGMFAWLAKNIIFWFSSLFFGLAAWFLDASIAMSLNSSTLTNLTTINDGWKVVCDVCNMFFIFALLYIAIATILQATSFNWKKSLGNLIIAALLINFSLFFTKIIIDTSNMFAVAFYNSMQTDIGGTTFYGPGVILKDGLGLETTFEYIDGTDTLGEEKLELTNMNRGIIWLCGAVFQVVAGFVFFAGSIIFLRRTIVFIFLMILSPFGFVGFILPGTKKYSDMWWDSLTENAVVAPVFLFMIYLVCSIVRSGTLATLSSSDHTSLALAFTGDESNYTMILHFVILIGLMWGAIIVAQKVSSAAATAGIGFAGKATGGIVAGTAFAGRRFGGEAGRMVRDSEGVKNMALSKNVAKRWAGQRLLQGGDVAAKSSWDIRRGKYGDPVAGVLGTGSMIGVGGINTGLGKQWGTGGRQAAVEAHSKADQEKDTRMGNIIATDANGKPRIVIDPVTGEKVAARELYARGLEKKAKKLEFKDGENSVLHTLKYLKRDEMLTNKKSAELVRKGDKDSKDAIRKEQISTIENNIKNALDKQDFEGVTKIMGDLTSEHIKDMKMELLVKPEVAMNLDISGLKAIQKRATVSERQQIRTALEDSANWQGRNSSSVPGRTIQWLNGPSGGNEF